MTSEEAQPAPKTSIESKTYVGRSETNDLPLAFSDPRSYSV